MLFLVIGIHYKAI